MDLTFFSSAPMAILTTFLMGANGLADICIGNWLEGVGWLGLLAFLWWFSYLPALRRWLEKQQETVCTPQTEYERLKQLEKEE